MGGYLFCRWLVYLRWSLGKWDVRFEIEKSSLRYARLTVAIVFGTPRVLEYGI